MLAARSEASRSTILCRIDCTSSAIEPLVSITNTMSARVRGGPPRLGAVNGVVDDAAEGHGGGLQRAGRRIACVAAEADAARLVEGQHVVFHHDARRQIVPC